MLNRYFNFFSVLITRDIAIQTIYEWQHCVISEEPRGRLYIGTRTLAAAAPATAAVHLTRYYGRLLSVGTAQTVPFLFKKSPAAKLKKK